MTDRLAAVYGAAAVRDLAEELAVDLAEAFAALAAAEGRPALTVLDGWFHDVPPPCTARHPTAPETATTGPLRPPAAARSRRPR